MAQPTAPTVENWDYQSRSFRDPSGATHHAATINWNGLQQLAKAAGAPKTLSEGSEKLRTRMCDLFAAMSEREFDAMMVAYRDARPGPAPEASPEASPAPVSPAPVSGDGSEDGLDPARAALGVLSAAQTESMIHDIVAVAINNAPRPVQIVLPDNATVDLPPLHHPQLPNVIMSVDAGVYPCLTGPAGSGKTSIARQVAKALGREFGLISLCAVPQTAELFGFRGADGTKRETRFEAMFRDGGVFLFDELDAGHPGTLVAINAALACQPGETASFAGEQVPRHEDFVAIGAANTLGMGATSTHNGRTRLDGATRDRFGIWLDIDYDTTLEDHLAQGHNPTNGLKIAQRIRAWRESATEQSIDVIIGTRAIITAAKLDAKGMDAHIVASQGVLSGIPDTLRGKIGAPLTTTTNFKW